MGATTRNSTMYANRYVNKYLGDGRDGGGRAVPLPFELTVVSPSVQNDLYYLTVIPAGACVVGLQCVSEAMGASGGSGSTCAIGDTGDDDRYMAATDMDLLNAAGQLASAGFLYRPAVDTIVIAKFPGTAPIVGKKIKGCLWVIPGA